MSLLYKYNAIRALINISHCLVRSPLCLDCLHLLLSTLHPLPAAPAAPAAADPRPASGPAPASDPGGWPSPLFPSPATGGGCWAPPGRRHRWEPRAHREGWTRSLRGRGHPPSYQARQTPLNYLSLYLSNVLTCRRFLQQRKSSFSRPGLCRGRAEREMGEARREVQNSGCATVWLSGIKQAFFYLGYTLNAT